MPIAEINLTNGSRTFLFLVLSLASFAFEIPSNSNGVTGHKLAGSGDYPSTQTITGTPRGGFFYLKNALGLRLTERKII